MLRRGKESDAANLAKIHLLEFSSDFLPSLGQSFLHLLYSNLLADDNVYIWIEDSNDQVHGFIAGSKNFNSVFKNVIIKNLIKYTVILIPQVLRNPKLVKNIFETLFYPKREGVDKPKAELIIIAILKKYRRKGLGKSLVLALEKDFMFHKVKQYKVSMNAKNLVANSFYLSLGFTKSHDFYLYNQKVSLFTKLIK